MNVKEAVAQAKQYIFELFSDESPKNIGLEEVEFDEQANEWLVTIGFSRPWDMLGESSFAAIASRQTPPARAYKIVRISNDKDEVLSVKSREIFADGGSNIAGPYRQAQAPDSLYSRRL